MTKVLILGDIHGRTIWKDIISKEDFDKVVFLGDYVDTHEYISSEEQIDNLKDILSYKEDNTDKVILLRGNHDCSELGYYWAKCSGYNVRVARKMIELKDRFLNDTQWVFALEENNKFYVFSHAGISNTWLESAKKYGASCIMDINNLEPSELFGFTPNSVGDMSGTSITQPCTWIRPESLLTDMPENIIQIVGHTPVIDKCINITAFIRSRKKEGSVSYQKFASVPDLWLCDALHNNSYLILDNQLYERTC